jgi:SAM-dependent methyltransferase
MKLELGCGRTKKEGYLGVDLVSEADIQMDMLEYLLTLEDNAVDTVRSYHSLEHLPKEKFVRVFKEILRTCKNGSIIEIGVPYHTQYVNLGNPYHKMYFNEHTFRFFVRDNDDHYNVIPRSGLIRDYSFGLYDSANEGPLPGYVRIKTIDYVYLPEYENKSEEEKQYARLHLNNVVLEMNIILEVVK